MARWKFDIHYWSAVKFNQRYLDRRNAGSQWYVMFTFTHYNLKERANAVYCLNNNGKWINGFV